MGTVSGDMKVTYTSCPKELNMDSTSGDCTISLPKGSSVTAELDSVSGDFSSEFSTRYEEEDVYIIGSGECEFSVLPSAATSSSTKEQNKMNLSQKRKAVE